jgi:DNA-directed RNA polymerase specialized sigma subunit
VPEDKDVRNADGAVFHTAAAQMLQLKKDALLFSCHTGNDIRDKALMTQVNLLMLTKEDWTERQRNIFMKYAKSGRQEEVAQGLKVTQQTVSKALKAIKAVQVQKLEQALNEWCLATLNEP